MIVVVSGTPEIENTFREIPSRQFNSGLTHHFMIEAKLMFRIIRKKKLAEMDKQIKKYKKLWITWMGVSHDLCERLYKSRKK